MKAERFYQKKSNSMESKKLVTTLEDKEKYVVHIATLKQALYHGLKLKKIHRVIEFKQKAWMKPSKYRTKETSKKRV